VEMCAKKSANYLERIQNYAQIIYFEYFAKSLKITRGRLK